MALPRAKLTGILIKELAGVDKGAQGRQPAVIMKRDPGAAGLAAAVEPTSVPVTKATFQRVVKQALLTSEVDGHQHTIDLDDPGRYYCDTLSTSYQTSEGADCGHSHAWVYDKASGAITIAADSGHSHTVDGAVPASTLAFAAARDTLRTLETAQRTAQIGAEVVQSAMTSAASGEVSITVVAQRAAQSESPPNTPVHSVDKQQEQTQMAETNLRKVLATALLIPEAHRLHAAKLDGDDAVVFLEKSSADRESIVKAAVDADPIEHTMADGTVIRKSAGSVAISLAKQLDTQAKLNVETTTQLEKARLETERISFEKRADIQLSHFAKALPVRSAIVKAIDGIADEAVRKEAHAALSAANAVMKLAGQPNGVTTVEGIESADPAQAYVNLETGLVTFAKAKNISKVWTEGLTAFEQTPEGAALVAAYENANTGAQ